MEGNTTAEAFAAELSWSLVRQGVNLAAATSSLSTPAPEARPVVAFRPVPVAAPVPVTAPYPPDKSSSTSSPPAAPSVPPPSSAPAPAGAPAAPAPEPSKAPPTPPLQVRTSTANAFSPTELAPVSAPSPKSSPAAAPRASVIPAPLAVAQAAHPVSSPPAVATSARPPEGPLAAQRPTPSKPPEPRLPPPTWSARVRQHVRPVLLVVTKNIRWITALFDRYPYIFAAAIIAGSALMMVGGGSLLLRWAFPHSLAKRTSTPRASVDLSQGRPLISPPPATALSSAEKVKPLVPVTSPEETGTHPVTE